MLKLKVNNPANTVSMHWKVAFIISLVFSAAGIYCYYQIFSIGLGVLDINNYIAWGILITSFVFWIGISHAGTFISAILLLLNQEWRRSINRAAEAMTIIAIIIAGMMPIIHLGKPLLFYQVLPFTNKTTYNLSNFTSPLTWDFLAIATYLILSLIFFHIGLMPDLATLRDKATNRIKKNIWNFFSFGWTGSYFSWQNQHKTLLILAGLITPLVISVHSIVSYDFAVTIKPGWHSSIYPFYFVTGAILSGFAMISMIVVIARKFLDIRESISISHLENMNKIILFTGTLLLYIYLSDIFTSLSSGNHAEIYNLTHKLTGHYWWLYLFMLMSTLILPQMFWSKKTRTSPRNTFLITSCVVTGMFLERFFIVVGTAERGFLTSAWADYRPTLYVFGILAGNTGLFSLMLLLLFRFIPFTAQYENKMK